MTVMSNMGFFKFCEENAILCQKTAVGDRYTIDFSCYDGVEENSFSGRFSGGIRYFEPSDFAVAKSCSVKTKSGDVLVSTAHVRDGKHVGSRRLARIPQPSRQ